jgi:hypothetical protein
MARSEPDDDDIEAMLQDAADMEHGPARIAVCEEAVRRADTRNDLVLAYRARVELVEAASFGGKPDTLLVTFSWLLSQFDCHPELFGNDECESELLWRYKWVIADLPSFPQFSRQRIEELLADMKARYRKAGSTLHGFYHELEGAYVAMGDRKAASDAHRRMTRVDRDWLSTCEACVQDRLIDYHALFGRYEQAVAAAEPILKGRLTCESVPERTYGCLLFPLFKLGRVEEAMQHHRTGYRLAAGKTGSLNTVEQHVRFLTLTANFDRAIRIAEKHFPLVVAYPSPDLRRDWYATLRFLFDLLRDRMASAVRFRFPADHPLKLADDTHLPAALFEWFDREARSLAADFDARNGNNRYSAEIDEQEGLKKRMVPLPYRNQEAR